MDIRQIALDYVDMICDEYDMKELYLSDIVHEVVDGASEVQYTHESIALVNSLSTEEIYDADESVQMVTDSSFVTYNRHVQLIAYFALEAAIYEQFHKREEEA